jgi:hypothetical protein
MEARPKLSRADIDALQAIARTVVAEWRWGRTPPARSHGGVAIRFCRDPLTAPDDEDRLHAASSIDTVTLDIPVSNFARVPAPFFGAQFAYVVAVLSHELTHARQGDVVESRERQARWRDRRRAKEIPGPEWLPNYYDHSDKIEFEAHAAAIAAETLSDDCLSALPAKEAFVGTETWRRIERRIAESVDTKFCSNFESGCFAWQSRTSKFGAMSAHRNLPRQLLYAAFSAFSTVAGARSITIR